MHARISMSELNKPEDRSMIAHARDKCARRLLFFSDIIYRGHYIESSALASAVRNCRCPWKLESYVLCAFLIGEDCRAICVRV